jgi:hypothetical protein
LSVFELRLILRKLPKSLIELHLIGARVDFGKQLARVHHLSFREMYGDELAVYAALDRNGVKRSDRAQPAKIHRDLAGADRCGNHGHRPVALPLCHTGHLGLLLLLKIPVDAIADKTEPGEQE